MIGEYAYYYKTLQEFFRHTYFLLKAVYYNFFVKKHWGLYENKNIFRFYYCSIIN